MSRVALKDAHYRVVGYIDTERDGKQRALDATYRVVGTSIRLGTRPKMRPTK